MEAANRNGQNRRVVIPHRVQDYVVSSNLAQALYRGDGGRFYLFQNGTNALIPDPGFWCRAPEMDFSPAGRYAAFFPGDNEVMVELGGYVCLVDIALKRMGPVMRGESAIALSGAYSERLDF